MADSPVLWTYAPQRNWAAYLNFSSCAQIQEWLPGSVPRISSPWEVGSNALILSVVRLCSRLSHISSLTIAQLPGGVGIIIPRYKGENFFFFFENTVETRYGFYFLFFLSRRKVFLNFISNIFTGSKSVTRAASC